LASFPLIGRQVSGLARITLLYVSGVESVKY